MIDETRIIKQIKERIINYQEARRKGLANNGFYIALRSYLDGIEACVGTEKVVELYKEAKKQIYQFN